MDLSPRSRLGDTSVSPSEITGCGCGSTWDWLCDFEQCASWTGSYFPTARLHWALMTFSISAKEALGFSILREAPGPKTGGSQCERKVRPCQADQMGLMESVHRRGLEHRTGECRQARCGMQLDVSQAQEAGALVGVHSLWT